MSDPELCPEKYALEKLLRKHTSFSEGIKSSWKTSEEQKTFSTLQNGLEQRYNIDAIVFELNANWIASLNIVPEAKDWMTIGANLNTVFSEYLNHDCPIK